MNVERWAKSTVIECKKGKVKLTRAVGGNIWFSKIGN